MSRISAPKLYSLINSSIKCATLSFQHTTQLVWRLASSTSERFAILRLATLLMLLDIHVLRNAKQV